MVLRLQMAHQGVGATWTGTTTMTAVTARQACISSAAVEIDFAEDFEQLVWRIPKGKLEQKLALMTGRPIGYALDFAPSLDLSTPQGIALKSVFDCLVQAAQTTPEPAASPVVVELEQAFIALFLSTVDHTGRALLEREAAGAAPWQVRRAESHIEANWDKPITIEDLASVAGTSSRSLFRTFKESRGCSPLDFVRRLRLDHAKRMLDKPDTVTTVTDVAFACGFGDLGRFARNSSEPLASDLPPSWRATAPPPMALQTRPMTASPP
ncbi:MAG: helix-turn-helix transcriptional regulator [Rhodospirillaceae bacterium]|nr:helix-turn-helix transcriptional regulator [Rhodospirillaceae bacterium]